jgi:LysM repeat protein
MNYSFNENQLIGIVKNTINEIEEERSYNVFSKLIKDIDMSRGVHFRNMKKMTESKREIYLNNVIENYMIDFFPRNTFIQENFDKNFTRNILFESPNRNFRKLFEFFDFFKKAVLLECGMVNKRKFKNLIREFDILGAAGDFINKGVQMGKDVVNKGIEVGKKVVSAVSPYVKKFLDSEFAYLVPGVNVAKLAYDANKIYQNWDKIKKMTFEDWAEAFRSFLNGVTGIAIQIVLALTQYGNIANWIANGFMLIYDVAYQGFGKGNWNFYNILTSAIALVGTGAAAAVLKPVGGILKGVTSASKVGPALAKFPQVFSKIGPLIKSIGGGIGKIMGWVTKAFTVFTTKFPLIGRFLKPLGGAITKIKSFLDEIVYGVKKYFKGGALQNAPTKANIGALKTGHAHFDTASIAKKLLATGDKTLTKKVVGGLTKLYYTIKVGDTLQKIISKFKPQGVTADVLKQLNFDHGLEIKPGHKIRVA